MIVTIRDLVRDAIVNALAETEGDKASAAMALGISLKTLYNHIHRNAMEGEYIDAGLSGKRGKRRTCASS